MKINTIFTFILCLSTTYANAEQTELSWNVLSKLINTDKVEYGAIVTPFGIYVTRAEGRWGKSGKTTIYEIDSKTSAITPASFSNSKFSDSDPFYHHTNKQLCFVSTRPVRLEQKDNPNGDIWCVERESNAWGEALRLPEPVNSSAREYSPVFDVQGQLYFASDRSGGFGQGDIYQAILTTNSEKSDWVVTNLGPAINTKHGEWNLGLRPDGKAMIIEASSRPENLSIPGDLYFSEIVNGEWSQSVALSGLNTNQSDLMARWLNSGDNEQLVYASARKGQGDVDHYLAHSQEWQPLAPTLVSVSRSDGEVVLMDPVNLRERRKIKVGIGSHEIAFSSDGRIAFVPSFGIYPQPHNEPVIKRPPFLSAPSEGVSSIDLLTGNVEQSSLLDCKRPHGVATDYQATRVWITCEVEGTIVEYDPKTWKSNRSFRLDKGVHKVSFTHDYLIATNPDIGTAYRIELKTGEVKKLVTGAGAEGIAISHDGKNAWVVNSSDATLCKIKIVDMSASWCVKTGGKFPIAITEVADKDELWVSRLASQDIAVFSKNDGKMITSLTLPSGALGLTSSRNGNLVYASLPRLNQVVSINTSSKKIMAANDSVMEGDDVKMVR